MYHLTRHRKEPKNYQNESKLFSIISKPFKTRNNNLIPRMLLNCFDINARMMRLALKDKLFSFDFSSVYVTGEVVIDAIQNRVEFGSSLSRKDFYFSYQLNENNFLKYSIIDQINPFLNKVGKIFSKSGAYIDILFVPPLSNKILIKTLWDQLEWLIEQHYIKEIGTVNYNISYLTLLDSLDLRYPAVNRVESRTSLKEKNLMAFCDEKEIIVSAHCNDEDVLQMKIMKNICIKTQLTPIQVLNSWKYMKGYQIVHPAKNSYYSQELKFIKILDPVIIEELDRFF